MLVLSLNAPESKQESINLKRVKLVSYTLCLPFACYFVRQWGEKHDNPTWKKKKGESVDADAAGRTEVAPISFPLSTPKADSDHDTQITPSPKRTKYL